MEQSADKFFLLFFFFKQSTLQASEAMDRDGDGGGDKHGRRQKDNKDCIPEGKTRK